MSNARQVGTIVGSLIAAYFTAGASYAALATAAGGAAGGAIGGAIDGPTKTQGPRLDDLKVQFSNYGVGIPTLYATERFSGNVIWSTDKLEIPNVQSSGGKGGGTENTSYKYYVHMRQLLCETPRNGSIVSLVKIFQDGKLIWDASSGIAVGSALASAENPYSSFILYQGHQDQLPNAEEESWTGGPGSASAYRGIVSIYMRAIECPGGRVPQFSFVLSNGATVTTTTQTYGTALQRVSGVADTKAIMARGEIVQIQNYPLANSPGVRLTRVQRSGSTSIPDQVYSLQPADVHWAIIPISSPDGLRGLHPYATGPAFYFGLVDFDSGSEVEYMVGTLTAPWIIQNGAYAVEDDGVVLVKDSSSNNIALLPAGTVIDVTSAERGVGLSGGFIYVITYGSSKLTLTKMTLGGVFVSSVENPTTMSVGPRCRVYSSDEGIFVVAITADGLGKRPIWKVSETEWVTLCADTAVVPEGSSYGEAYATDTYALIGPSQNDAALGEVSYQMVRFNVTTPVSVKVKDIIADQCERAGETRYDVSGIPDSDTVYGYKIAGPASARANIEPLLTLIGGYVVDEDGVIKFKKFADIESVATISFDELGQVEDGSEPGDAMPLNRTQEIDLPRSVTTSYIEPTSDFQIAGETEVRQVTRATEDMQIQLPVCVSSDQAKKVSVMVLYDQHRRQNTRSLTVSRKFAFVSPGDGVTVEYPRGTFKLWLVLAANDTGAVCEWSVAPGDAAIFTQTAVGATGYTGQQVSPLAPTTTLVLLDMPILRDADNNGGVYAALKPSGAAADWRGATLLASDDGVTYQDKGSVTTPAVTGFAETVLASASGWMIDHTSRVTVNVGEGELHSTTWDTIFANGTANLAALKASFNVDGFDGYVEVFQFRAATSLGGGRYVLSEMVRCMYGTERVSFNHQVGDTFVLLSGDGMLRHNLDPGASFSGRYYKAVSFGRDAESTPSIASRSSAYGLNPLSPVGVKLDRTPANGSVVFTWGRRTRLSHHALRSIMPLGEASEVYEVVIYTDFGRQVVRSVYRVYSTTFTYTALSLATDGYTQLGSIPYRIYQISDAIGRGVPFQEGAGVS